MSRSERVRQSAGLAAVFMLLGACSGPSLEVLDVAPITGELPDPARFLQADGDQLVWAGEPFRFLSLNAFTLTGCGNADEQFDAVALDEFFAALRPRSLVRTYAFEAQRPEDIDAVVRAAARHDQLLNLVLTDANGSCGDDGVRKDEAWFAGGFRDTYLPWVKQIVTRERAETSVGMWELVSSPSSVHPETLRAFYDEVGAFVHQLAPRQLVSSGTHGVWAYGSAENYRLIHDSPGVDVAGFRDYEQEPGAPPNLQAALDAIAGTKPVILAEAGVFASPEGDATKTLEGRVCVSWAERTTVLQSWVEAAFQTRLAGIDVWNYLPVRRESCEYSTHKSDPLFSLVHDTPLP